MLLQRFKHGTSIELDVMTVGGKSSNGVWYIDYIYSKRLGLGLELGNSIQEISGVQLREQYKLKVWALTKQSATFLKGHGHLSSWQVYSWESANLLKARRV